MTRQLYSWTAWRDGDSIKIAGINEDGFRIPAQDFEKREFQLLTENAHPERPGCTAEVCKLLSTQGQK
jgi:hypothetical protein